MSTSIHAVPLRDDSRQSVDTTESLGALLLAALPPLRLQSVSLFDVQGNVLWLNEGSLGPDEQAFAEEALGVLSAARNKAHLENARSDGRGAIFLAVRSPNAALSAVVMILLEAKMLSSGNVAARILTSNMRSLLQRIAVLVRPPPPLPDPVLPPPPLAAIGAAGDGPTATATISAAADYASLEWTPPPPAAETSEEGILHLLAPEEAGQLAASRSLPEASGALEVPVLPPLQLRELMRLRSGGRTRRFQVAVPAAQLQRDDPLATLTSLLAWLEAHPQALEGDPLSLAIGVSEQALADPQLPAQLSAALAAVRLAPESIGFELQEAACVRQRPLAERFIAQCERSGCFVLIDGFTFDSAGLELLRSSAVRVLKVEAQLLATALRDKLAQARIIAIAQAAKVLGMHCAAPQVDSQSGRRWLTAVGFDFSQSTRAEPLQRLLEP